MMVEPWLRGTLTEVDAVRRQVLHALEQAGEDIERWCAELSDAEIHARPYDIAPVAFHLRHMGGSLDRLLTYAEGGSLSEAQIDALGREMNGAASTEEVMAKARTALGEARRRILDIPVDSYEKARSVGRSMLPSTVGGLVVHCADHTQRHVGQAITTAKMIRGMRQA